MDLHRPKRQPDWMLVGREERNPYQKISAATHGIITPANVITVLGMVLVLYGVWLMLDEVTLIALAFIAGGRLVDILDGIVADKTGTKSTVGEAFDSVADKVTAVVMLVVIASIGIFQLWQVIILLLLQLINSVATLYAKFSHKSIHSSLEGKQATFLLWLTIGLHAVDYWLNLAGVFRGVLQVLGIVSFWLAVIRGVQASYGYVRDLFK
jgi:phosphatidylglycerophosphate synthase